jgi:hypothetical protein
MMLAEIGLPPGADLDRASLDALSTSLYDVQSYEIQLDRLVFYLWPRAGGTTFSFSLKPRFASSAQSAESLLDDYYNPEARASVPPPPSPSTNPPDSSVSFRPEPRRLLPLLSGRIPLSSSP